MRFPQGLDIRTMEKEARHYFSALRAHWTAWDRAVWWLSLIGLLTSIAGRAFLVARGDEGPARVLWLDVPPSALTATIPASVLIAGIRAAWPNQPVTDRGSVSADDLYSIAEGMPDGRGAFRIGGSKRVDVDVCVDSVSGRIVTVMDSSRRGYAWIYYALHTFKFPGLAAHPGLRHAAVLIPLVLGFAFSVTGIVVGFARLRASLGAGVTS
jgi:hypothetical protein